MATKLTVLIVDEDLNSRVETRKAVQRAGLTVAGEVGFGTHAVTRAAETKPSAILLAIEEPVMRPLETAEVLANALPNTPLIFYATSSDAEAVRRAVLFGARDYLVKPLQANSVSQSVEQAIAFEEKRQARKEGELSTAEVRGTVIVVAGAKGGIGKSILSVNLAVALQRQTRSRVAIVDADTHFGDVATMLDLTPTVTAGSLFPHLDTVDRESINSYLTPYYDGLAVLAGPGNDDPLWEDSGPGACSKIVELLALSHDFIVVDTSGAMDSYVHALAEVATLILMLSTGEVSSVRDTKAGLERLKKWCIPDDKVKLVLNRGARAEGFQVGDLEKSFDRDVFWELPRDKHVPLSVQLGQPFVISKPTSPAARQVADLAALIGGNVLERRRTGRSLWGLRGRTESTAAV